MSTQLAGSSAQVQARRSLREAAVSGLGPLVVAGGLLWALLQPYRLTILSPRGEGIWWLLVEPPLLVIAVGALFHFAIRPGLVDDLRADEEEQR